MVTTLVRSTGNRTNELWRFVEEASRTDTRLAKLEHPFLNNMLSKCPGRIPIYVHPFYRGPKVEEPHGCRGNSQGWPSY